MKKDHNLISETLKKKINGRIYRRAKDLAKLVQDLKSMHVKIETI
jgi:hypothetical protein